jgi:hypothetical protein
MKEYHYKHNDQHLPIDGALYEIGATLDEDRPL